MTTARLCCKAGGSPAVTRSVATGAIALRVLNYLDSRVVTGYHSRGVSDQGSAVTLRPSPVLAMCFSLLVFSAISPVGATIVTFDDISSIRIISSITNGYQSLSWSNVFCLNAVLHNNLNGVSGYYYGMVSVSNVAYSGNGEPAEIDARGTNFDFLSAYLTGAWNSNLNIEVEGFRSGTLLYDTTVVASATAPTLFAFNYLDIDRLTFNSFDGQNAGFPSGAGEQFAMDNFTFEFVPEPSSLLLASLAALLLSPLLKRRRA